MPRRPLVTYKPIAAVTGGLLLSISFVLLGAVCTGPLQWARNLTTETGPVETLSALAYLAALLYCLRQACLSSRGQRKILLLFWACVSFFLLAEETSWGQHIFNYTTPECIKSYNAQGEINLHNLKFWHAPSWHQTLTEGGSDYLGILFSAANLFRITFVLHFLLVPLWCSKFNKPAIFHRFYNRLPDKIFIFPVWLLIGISIIAALICEPERIKAISETREMFYAFTILFYILNFLIASKKNEPQAPWKQRARLRD